MSHTVTVKIYDLGVNSLADISGISLTKSMTTQLNGPSQFIVTVPCNESVLSDVATDGYPNLHAGNRKLVVWEDGDPSTDDPIFHGRIFTIERDGDENSAEATITAYDPFMELGFEADNRAGRVVRDNTRTLVGDPSFFSPMFSSSVPGQAGLSGPDLIQQILTYTQSDPTTNPIQGEGKLPIDVVSGTWDLDVPPAIDINPVDSADWPVMVGDFINQLIATGAVDLKLRPIRPGAGIGVGASLDDFIMVEASSQSKIGTDLTGTVHFDYMTGSKNASACKHVQDFSTYCDRLWYELGPRLTKQGWRGDITPHGTYHPGLITLMDDAAAIYGGPDAWPGRFASISVYDSLGSENASRPLYEELYRDEIVLRVMPRSLLFITPAADAKGLFTAPQDFDIFDLIQIQTGAGFGIVLDEAQRVYGYTKTWDARGVATLSQLVTSADAVVGGE